MFVVLLLVFIIVPIIELFLFVQVASWIGFFPALAWIIGVSFLGAWMIRRQGVGVWRRANALVAQGKVPTNELIDGIVILFGGALMMTPGFLTDIFGLLLLTPPVRAVLRRLLRARFLISPIVLGGRAAGMAGNAAGFGRRRSADRNPFGSADDDIVDAESWEDPPERPMLP